MNIEIHGAGFRNKGAELMLHTVLAELSNRLPQVRFALDPTVGDYEQRCGLGLWQTFPPHGKSMDRRFSPLVYLQHAVAPLLGQRLAARALALYGALPATQLHALIDIAGFAYADQLGPTRTRNVAVLARAFSRRGRPVILLPQALGPFRNEATREAMQSLLESTTLVFARDAASYDYVRSLDETHPGIFQAPDITIFHSCSTSPRQSAEGSRYACLVPNMRMLDQGGAAWQDHYLDALTAAARALYDAGLDLKILIHDTSGEDYTLATNLANRLINAAPEIIEEDDVLALKDIVARSRLLVGSRYHSLVAALASGVPALCMGWAHKYEMLFTDFDCRELVLDPDTPLSDVRERTADLATPTTNDAYRHRIRERLSTLAASNEEMWERVCEVLLH